MLCPNCGINVDRNDKFCRNCGYKINIKSMNVPTKKLGKEENFKRKPQLQGTLIDQNKLLDILNKKDNKKIQKVGQRQIFENKNLQEKKQLFYKPSDRDESIYKYYNNEIRKEANAYYNNEIREEANPYYNNEIREEANPYYNNEIREEVNPYYNNEIREEANPYYNNEIREETNPYYNNEIREETNPYYNNEIREEVNPYYNNEIREETNPYYNNEIREEVNPYYNSETREEETNPYYNEQSLYKENISKDDIKISYNENYLSSEVQTFYNIDDIPKKGEDNSKVNDSEDDIKINVKPIIEVNQDMIKKIKKQRGLEIEDFNEDDIEVEEINLEDIINEEQEKINQENNNKKENIKKENTKKSNIKKQKNKKKKLTPLKAFVITFLIIILIGGCSIFLIGVNSKNIAVERLKSEIMQEHTNYVWNHLKFLSLDDKTMSRESIEKYVEKLSNDNIEMNKFINSLRKDNFKLVEKNGNMISGDFIFYINPRYLKVYANVDNVKVKIDELKIDFTLESKVDLGTIGPLLPIEYTITASSNNWRGRVKVTKDLSETEDTLECKLEGDIIN